MRFLILLVVVIILMLLLKRLFSAAREPEQLTASSEDMRQCKYCGVHVPESSIVSIGEDDYCSREHAELDSERS